MGKPMVNPKKLEIELRTNSAGITFSLLLRFKDIGFPTLGLAATNPKFGATTSTFLTVESPNLINPKPKSLKP